MEFLKKSVKWKEPRQKSSTDFSFNKQTELSANHKYVCYENTLGYVQKKFPIWDEKLEEKAGQQSWMNFETCWRLKTWLTLFLP